MSKFERTMARLACAAAACLALAPTAQAHDHPGTASKQKEAIAPVQGSAAASGTRDARSYFTDLELQTHEGRTVRFYSDVLEGRTVLINVIFTNCQDACPLITQRLNEVRNLLGDQFGRDVHFVSISSDPARDSPAALRDFAKKQSADLSGWTFLTGSKQHVDQILKRLGQFSQDPQDHSTLLIAGNVPVKRWAKIRPDAPPLAIAERLKLLAAADSKSVPLPR